MSKVMYNNSLLLKVSQIFLAGLLFLWTASVLARGVYQTPEDFLQEVFNNELPKSQVVWVKGDLRKTLTDILGHKYAGLRVRYWQQDERSAWVLEEIGKEQPITFGIVINTGKVEQVKVLAFRESRGDEIRHRAFTQQFNGIGLKGTQLDSHIDGVSGATLSVWAMTAVTRMALYLDNFIRL